jgi:5-methyltetrahydropteroyltriglutamate--homocysteine methyltransferase
VTRWGTPPDELLRLYARRLNDVVTTVPDHVTVTLHQCRGDREAHWDAAGGYDPVAEVLFNEIDVDGYFLEYDSERAGGFEPLRLLPKGKVAVLGIMSTKSAELESADFLKRRVEEATKYAPLEQLGIAPQCGFARSIGGRPMTQERQEEKLARLIEVARSVWH